MLGFRQVKLEVTSDIQGEMLRRQLDIHSNDNNWDAQIRFVFLFPVCRVPLCQAPPGGQLLSLALLLTLFSILRPVPGWGLVCEINRKGRGCWVCR